jgi:hypothetical protein
MLIDHFQLIKKLVYLNGVIHQLIRKKFHLQVKNKSLLKIENIYGILLQLIVGQMKHQMVVVMLILSMNYKIQILF